MIDDKVIYEKSTIKSWANAVRTVKGTTEEFPSSQMEQEILSLGQSENLDAELTEQENALTELESEIESLDDKEPSKIALLVGAQDAANNGYEITADDLEGVTEIGNYAFCYRTGMKNIDLSNITSIGENALLSCDGLTSVNMPKVASLGRYAFYDCGGLTSVDMPNVTSLGNFSLQYCGSLTSVNMPNVTSIGASAFKSCTDLTFLTIPTTCTSIGAGALQCGSTTKKCVFRFEGDVPPTIQSGTFTASNVERIEVKVGCGDTYKTTTNFTTLADKIVEVDF